MIIGHGVDFIEIDRIKKIFQSPMKDKFIEKYFKFDHLNKVNSNQLSNNFAIKEAFSKALGFGFRRPCYPSEIAVSRNLLGRPIITPQEKLNQYLVENYENFVIHVSVTDNIKYSLASVILEKI